MQKALPAPSFDWRFSPGLGYPRPHGQYPYRKNIQMAHRLGHFYRGLSVLTHLVSGGLFDLSGHCFWLHDPTVKHPLSRSPSTSHQQLCREQGFWSQSLGQWLQVLGRTFSSLRRQHPLEGKHLTPGPHSRIWRPLFHRSCAQKRSPPRSHPPPAHE